QEPRVARELELGAGHLQLAREAQEEEDVSQPLLGDERHAAARDRRKLRDLVIQTADRALRLEAAPLLAPRVVQPCRWPAFEEELDLGEEHRSRRVVGTSRSRVGEEPG